MRILATILSVVLFAVSCRTATSQSAQSLPPKMPDSPQSSTLDSLSIRKIDFENFDFPWTKTLGLGEKSFTLKNGEATLKDERRLKIRSLSYAEIGEDEEALVSVDIDDGNASYEMLFIFAVENNKPKLLQSFEFGENSNEFLATAFGAHGELIIETYLKQDGDAECCPSLIQILNYKWQKDSFVLQGEPQKVSNSYVERAKRNRAK